MSDYYQQQVTRYMMRRAKRRASDVSTVSADEPGAEGSVKGGWMARLGALFPRQRTQSPVAPSISRPSGETETA